MSSHAVTGDFPTICSLIWKAIFFTDHATISATIPASICLCIVSNRKSLHKKLLQFFVGGFHWNCFFWNHFFSREIRFARVCARYGGFLLRSRPLRRRNARHARWGWSLWFPPQKSPASRQGRDNRGFHRRATFPYMLPYFGLSAHVLPHFAIFCHMLQCLAHIFSWTLIRGNHGTSATTPFVTTPSGSRWQNKSFTLLACARKNKRATHMLTHCMWGFYFVSDPGIAETLDVHDEGEACVTTQNTTTTRVPSFFCPRSRTTSEVVVSRALGLYVLRKLLEI